MLISVILLVAAGVFRPPCLFANIEATRLTDYVDPRIGSEGLGRVFVGPAMPFGMVRPSPDCTVAPNSGWLPMPAQVDGFAQVHVSGTGGGPKYGNILIQPFCGALSASQHIDYRDSEDISLGYYATTYRNSGIRTEITTAARASAYRISYPQGCRPALAIDAGFFLGESPVPDAREAQQFVGSQVQVVSPTEVRGYSRIRGGWNNGRAYTVYFCLTTDRPAVETKTWKGSQITSESSQYDSGEKTGALLAFAADTDTLNVRIGISFISELKAHENMQAETAGKSFDEIHRNLLDAWESLLAKIEIDPGAPKKHKRMFYTALYHTMLMPSDRTGENPLWTDPVPYYDDFYAIWDTYRTSLPLITLIDPRREADIVNSLVNIGKRDGYMPDARSGNANGRTQGGSNAEIVIADAFVKGVPGIDYEAALQAMLKDAEVDPGANHEAEGRGGLTEYLKLGYVPHGIARAGNRTVEYSYCDYAIHEVAKGLGHDKIADRYLRQSGNWKNLWRDGYEHDGAVGFIMPRDEQGDWLDELPYGNSERRKPTFRYTPLMFEGPWYTPWWSMFFYEASAWEYSLSIPHDVPGLIEKCGGAAAFEQRLDTFFDKNYFNVNNEPSFLSPCLYHWIGRPERSSDRVLEIIAKNYSDTPAGLPGNDDSGAMSSWLAFHMTGLYPNAGQDYYLIHTPLLKTATFNLGNGRQFRIVAENLSEKNRYIQSMTLNGKKYAEFTLSHADLMAGGELKLKMGPKPMKSKASAKVANIAKVAKVAKVANIANIANIDTSALSKWQFVYKLHGQTRKFRYEFVPEADGGVTLHWSIERNLKWWSGSYTMTPEAMERGSSLSFRMPEDGNHLVLADNETFVMISRAALRSLKATGTFRYDGVDYRLIPDVEGESSSRSVDSARNSIEQTGAASMNLLRVRDAEGAELLILDDPRLPLILSMQRNPLEINWTAAYLQN